mgnify:CR=1 FL=1
MNQIGHNSHEKPIERIINPHDFDLLVECLREAEIEYYKQGVDFEKYCTDLYNKGVHIPRLEKLNRWDHKDKYLETQKRYRKFKIMLEMFLDHYPYAVIRGDYEEWEEIYKQRYKNTERTGYDENA